MSRPTFTERLLSKIAVPADPDGCWEWLGGLNARGYGQITIGRTKKVAHRATWEHYNGPIPSGKVLDHLCYRPSCVRPDHLRVTTNAENLQNRPGAFKNNKTGYRGVDRTRSGRYRAQAQLNGVKYLAGVHDTPEEAAEAARQLRLRIFTHNDKDRLALHAEALHRKASA